MRHLFGLENIDHPKKISVSELWVIFRGSPLFLDVLGLCRFRGISTPNFGQLSMQLGGTVRAIKKMTQNDNGPGLGQKYGEWPFNVRLKSVFWAKIAFYPKITPKIS